MNISDEKDEKLCEICTKSIATEAILSTHTHTHTHTYIYY